MKFYSIVGPRGSGKTTKLLDSMKSALNGGKYCVYFGINPDLAAANFLKIERGTSYWKSPTNSFAALSGGSQVGEFFNLNTTLHSIDNLRGRLIDAVFVDDLEYLDIGGDHFHVVKFLLTIMRRYEPEFHLAAEKVDRISDYMNILKEVTS